MLTETLTNYSRGELVNLIGATYAKNYETLYRRELDQTELAKAAQILAGLEIIQEKQKRETFIKRMSSETVSKVLTSFLEICDYIKPLPNNCDKYSVLKELSGYDLKAFAGLFGFEEAFSLAKESTTSVAGIKNCPPDYPLYSYQQKIVHKVNTLIANQEEHSCLVHLPTGAGKTRTAMNIVCEHLRANEKGLVLWLADTAELCTQAINEFYIAWKSLGNRKLKMYSYFSDTPISLGGIDEGFLVAGLQKLNNARVNERSILYEKLREHVSLIVFDEAHKAIAPTYATAIKDMRINENKLNAFLLGLTATPGRKLNTGQGVSHEDKRLSDFFGMNKVTMKVSGYESPIQYLNEKKYLAKTTFHTIEYKSIKIRHADEFISKKYRHEICEALSKDENRNIQIINTIKDEYNKESSIIVFASSIEHSRSLAAYLAFEGIKAYSLDSKQDDSKTRRLKISEYSDGKVRVLINYGILTAGFDAPITNVVIIARPTESLVLYSQMAGRAMRGKKSRGNDFCDIYTVRDDIPAFTSVIEAFDHWNELWEEV